MDFCLRMVTEGVFERAKTTLKMLPDPWILVYFENGIRSFYTRDMGSVGQMASKLPAIKLWEWSDPGTIRTWAEWFD